jgi:hypothetical protein
MDAAAAVRTRVPLSVPSRVSVQGNGPLHELGQLPARAQRRAAALRDDGGRYPASVWFLTVAAQEVAQLPLVEILEQLVCRSSPAGIEAHVQRPLRAKAERSVGVGKLLGTQSQIEEDAIDQISSGLRGDPAELLEVGLAEDGAVAEALQPLPRPGDGRLVGIHAELAATRRGGLQDPKGVPPATDRRIDLEAAWNG